MTTSQTTETRPAPLTVSPDAPAELRALFADAEFMRVAETGLLDSAIKSAGEMWIVQHSPDDPEGLYGLTGKVAYSWWDREYDGGVLLALFRVRNRARWVKVPGGEWREVAA